MIDIIIPVYNSKKTLKRTLASISCQLKMPETKIYIIDDGSTEKYDEIIKQFESDLEIEYILLQENSGPGVARQKGIDCSRGEYVIFLDSDDVLASPLTVRNLYDVIKNQNVDIVRSIIYEELDEAFIPYYYDNIGLHGKIYKRSFFEENQIRFDKSRLNEDLLWNSLCRLYGAKYYDYEELTYFWCNNKESLCRKDYENHIQKDLETHAYSLKKAIDTVLKDKNYNPHNEIFYSFLNEILQDIYESRNMANKPTKEKIEKYIKELYHLYLKLGYNINEIEQEDLKKYLKELNK